MGLAHIKTKKHFSLVILGFDQDIICKKRNTDKRLQLLEADAWQQ